MCRIDYLNAGMCEPGVKSVYAAYYPYGRLRIFEKFASGELQLTDRLKDIVDSCTLCGFCNLQCYFVMELTPEKVMAAMKRIMKERLENESLHCIDEDDILYDFRKIVGEQWASNDPAVRLAYSGYGFISQLVKMPEYIVLPKDTDETAEIVKAANKHNLPFLPVTSGTNISYLAIGKGVLIDMNRMKTLNIDEFNYCAEIGAGVLAFDLQKAAMAKGLRMAIGEGAAGVCANQVSTGVHSFFSYRHGMMADNYLEAELVNPKGDIIQTSSAEAPNIVHNPDFQLEPKIPFICTKLKIKLHQVDDDETVVCIPFSQLADALAVMKKLSKKHVGTGMGLLSIECLKSFLSLTQEDEENFQDIARDYLKIHYGLLMMLNQGDLKILKEMFPSLTVLSMETVQKIIKGIPAITGPESMYLIESIMDEQRPYDHLFNDMLDYFLEQIVLEPDEVSELMSVVDDKRLRKALVSLYHQPEFSDIEYWYNYRMFAPRMTRNYWFLPKLLYTAWNDFALIEDICMKYKEIGDNYDIENCLCYITPIDGGKRLFIEYDYYYDQHDAKMLRAVKKAFYLADREIDEMAKIRKGIYPVRHTLFRGLGQKDLYIYK
jgi:hypothetical protein